jgi:hypothetical protein
VTKKRRTGRKKEEEFGFSFFIQALNSYMYRMKEKREGDHLEDPG